MRGRTNITQRAVPYVNGDVIEAEVEAGSVNVGDFVEYKTVSDLTPDQSIFNFWNRQEEIMGNYKILNYYNDTSREAVLELYSLTNGELLDSISFNVTNNTNYASFSIRNNNIIYAVDTSGIYLIRVVNNRFSVIDSSEFHSVTGQGYFRSVCFITDNRFILIYMTYNNSSPCYFPLYKIENDEIVWERSTNAIAYMQYYGYNFYSFSPDSDRFILFVEEKTSNSYYASRIYAWTYIFDNEFNFTSSNQQFSLPSTSTGAGHDGAFVKVNSNSVAYGACPSYGSSSANQIQCFMLFKYDSQTKTVSAPISTLLKPIYFPDAQNDHLNPSYYRYFLISMVEENVMLFMFAKVKGSNGYFDYSISLVNYNPNNNNIEYGEPIVLGMPENRGKGRVCIKYQNTIKVKYVETNTSLAVAAYIKRFQYVMNSISEFIDKNYVKQYAGNNAIGFAKTSGTAGENVRVYVPHQL